MLARLGLSYTYIHNEKLITDRPFWLVRTLRPRTRNKHTIITYVYYIYSIHRAYAKLGRTCKMIPSRNFVSSQLRFDVSITISRNVSCRRVKLLSLLERCLDATASVWWCARIRPENTGFRIDNLPRALLKLLMSGGLRWRCLR